MYKLLKFLLAIFMLIIVSGCPDSGEVDINEPDAPMELNTLNETDSIPDKYKGAVELARKMVFYRLAMQDGQMALYIVLPDVLEPIDVPRIPKMLNENWWGTDWGGARTSALPMEEMEALQELTLPHISARIDEVDDENGWVRMVMGYDSDSIVRAIADAHTDWIPDVRDIFLGRPADDCMLVWCVKVEGDWMIITPFECTNDVKAPEYSSGWLNQVPDQPE